MQISVIMALAVTMLVVILNGHDNAGKNNDIGKLIKMITSVGNIGDNSNSNGNATGEIFHHNNCSDGEAPVSHAILGAIGLTPHHSTNYK